MPRKHVAVHLAVREDDVVAKQLCAAVREAVPLGRVDEEGTVPTERVSGRWA